jgi:hypothetical protein
MTGELEGAAFSSQSTFALLCPGLKKAAPAIFDKSACGSCKRFA